MELWDLYDEERNRTGEYVERGGEIRQGLYHICVELFMINEKNEVLLTQRRPDKIGFPSYWEGTGGAVRKGESSHDAIMREVFEEVGIRMNPQNLYFLGECYWSNSIMDSYLYMLKGNPRPVLKLQEEEVAAARWIPLQQLANEDKIVTGKKERFLEKIPEICRKYGLVLEI